MKLIEIKQKAHKIEPCITLSMTEASHHSCWLQAEFTYTRLTLYYNNAIDYFLYLLINNSNRIIVWTSNITYKYIFIISNE